MIEETPFIGRTYTPEELEGSFDHPTMDMKEIELPLSTFSGFRELPEQKTTLTQAIEQGLQRLHEKTAWRHKLYHPTEVHDFIPVAGIFRYGLRQPTDTITNTVKMQMGVALLTSMQVTAGVTGAYLAQAIEQLLK